MHNNSRQYRYGSVPFETPRGGQSLSATGEGKTESADNAQRNDGVTLNSMERAASDDGRLKHSCRVSSKKPIMNIGTWNVRTMREQGKLTLLLQELDENKMNITGLCETRWSGSGHFTSQEHMIIYSGNDLGSNGVAVVLDKYHASTLISFNTINDRIMVVKLNTKPVVTNIVQVYAPTSESTEEEIEKFYNDLQAIKDKIPGREVTVIMGDFNAKIGEGEEYIAGVGNYGLGNRNIRGDMLSSFTLANEMLITNTLFNHPKRRRYTWMSPGKTYRNQIDYILIDKSWKTAVLDAKTKPGADCDTDHLLVVTKIRLKAYRRQKEKPLLRFAVEQLKEDGIKERYIAETENRFTILLQEWEDSEKTPNELWKDMKDILIACGEKILGKRKKRRTKPYISDEVLDLAKKKSLARKQNKGDDYHQLKREIQTKIRRDKREWLAAECEKINDFNMQKKSREMYQQIRKMKSAPSKPNQLCINDKYGKTLSEPEDILKRWNEYGSNLFRNDSNDDNDGITKSSDDTDKEPLPLMCEIEAAVKQLKQGKSPGLDNIPGEMIRTNGSAALKALHTLITKVWVTSDWPDDWKQQEFVMLHKSGDTKDCNNYRTIALISHTSKIMLTILLNRLKAKIDEEMSEYQAGFRQNRGTADMLFTIQILIEKVREVDQEAFLTFIDYSKAFDNVKHKHLFETMKKMGFPKHLVNLLENLYSDQRATIRWNNQHCEVFPIKKGVRQGCILSPHLFSIYTEQVMREVELDELCIKIGSKYHKYALCRWYSSCVNLSKKYAKSAGPSQSGWQGSWTQVKC